MLLHFRANGIQWAQVSLAQAQPLSSLRRRGPISTKVSVIAGPATIALLWRMGPRLRGDDSGESSLHIFASGNPALNGELVRATSSLDV